MRIVATARIIPGKVKRVRRRDRQVAYEDGATANRVKVGKVKAPRVVRSDWERDPLMPSSKGKEPCVTICISMSPQMFTDVQLFARKMRMNHSHLLREAVTQMMKVNGWPNGETP